MDGTACVFVEPYAFSTGRDRTDALTRTQSYYGGSHALFADYVCSQLASLSLITFPAKKWHWRVRTASLTLAQQLVSHPGAATTR